MEFFDTYGVMTWIILFVIFLIIELVTMGLTTIWFAGGALVSFVAGMLGAGLILQIVLFVAASILLLIFTRPLATKYFNKGRIKTNAESLVGQTALVTEEIDNLKATGKVTVQGMEWSARATNDEEIIAYGTKIKIDAIEGVKLMVSRKEEEQK